MRSGSGAVLLVGFALVVMLLSVAGAVTPPSIGMKQDPSQDFVDYASSIRNAVHSYDYLRGTGVEKFNYTRDTIYGLVKQYGTRGIDAVVVLTNIFGDRECIITPAGVSCPIFSDDHLNIIPNDIQEILQKYGLPVEEYIDNYDGVIAYYSLASKDLSSNFTGIAAGGGGGIAANLEQELLQEIRGGAGGAVALRPFYTIPPGIYFFRPFLKHKPLPAFALFFMLNLNPVRVDAVMSYSGSGEIKSVKIRVFEFPGDKNLLDYEMYKWDKNTGTITFSIDPSIIKVKKELDLKFGKLIIGHKYNIGIGTAWIVYGGDSGQIGTFHIEGINGYLSQDVPAYYNEYKGFFKGLIRGFRGIGNLPEG